jgi:hypothetical protein
MDSPDKALEDRDDKSEEMEIRDFEKVENSHIEKKTEHSDRSNSETIESAPNQTQEQTWEPPNGGYGWVCVATCFFINAHTWGLNSVRSLSPPFPILSPSLS